MFDLFVRLIRVNLYVRFFVRFHVRFFARYFCPTCSCPIFFWFFDPISCLIFPDFCPIFYVRFSLSDFFVRLVHVRFSLTDSFILFLSDLFYPTCLCPIFCPIFFVRFLPDSMSRLFVRFFVPFFGRFVVTFFVWFLFKKDGTCLVMYCHLCHVLSMC